MVIATYNQMYACNGLSLQESLCVNLWHILKEYDKIAKIADIKATADTIKKLKPDVIGVGEVLGNLQRKELIDKLKIQGFKSFHVGFGHRLTPKYGKVETLLATRLPSTRIFYTDPKVPAKPGFGGGIVGAHIKSKNMYIFQVHMAFYYGKRFLVYEKQLNEALAKIMSIHKKGPKAKIVIMGDFNATYTQLARDFFLLKNLTRLSPDTPTCSLTAFFKHFFNKSIDHMLGINLKVKKTGTMSARSDHKLLWIEV